MVVVRSTGTASVVQVVASEVSHWSKRFRSIQLLIFRAVELIISDQVLHMNADCLELSLAVVDSFEYCSVFCRNARAIVASRLYIWALVHNPIHSHNACSDLYISTEILSGHLCSLNCKSVEIEDVAQGEPIGLEHFDLDVALLLSLLKLQVHLYVLKSYYYFKIV